MNLIEIAEDLKNVPDQYLMQEVQQPTGNYPAYLVVSELSRRKRMREKVAKEMPTQTVAEELATPPQMPQGMPQMGTMMPEGAPQGLMAMPQAQTELAAQDVMGTTPPEMMMPQMAGGGMVSFKDGGDVQRFQNQGLVLGDTFGGFDFNMGDGVGFEFPNLTDEQKLEYIQGRVGYPQIAALREGTISLDEVFRNVYQPPSTPTAAPRVAPAAPPVRSPAAGSAPSGAPARAPVAQATTIPVQPAAGIPDALTPYALSTIGAQAASDYAQANPDRLTPFFQEMITKREGDIEKRRATNINDALIQAGLGAMRAKPKFRGSAGLFEVIGEGGQAGFDVLRQGRKDIRESEEAINAARAKMVESEMLRDERKFKAASDARKEAIELNNYGLNRAKTESAIALQNLQASKIPAEIGLLEAQADFARSGGRTAAGDTKAADEYARNALTMSGILPNNPKYMSEYARLRNEYLMSIAGGIPAAAAAAPVTGGAEFLRIRPE